MRRLRTACVAGIALAAVTGCDRDHAGHGHDHPPGAATRTAAAAPSNRIDIPLSVRQNLGITFAKAESRRVASTIRVTGRFELTPSARVEYHSSFPGRVELLVKQYEQVEAGQVLARVSSPEWHRLQLELEEDEAEVERAAAEVEVAVQTRAEAVKKIEAIEQRVVALRAAEVRRAELEAELDAARNSIPRLEAEIKAKRIKLDAARHHLPMAMAAAAASLGMSVEQMSEPVKFGDGTAPRWRALGRVEIRAASPGVVESRDVSNGAWVETAKVLLTTIDPRGVRFRATAMQSDLGRIAEGMAVAIVPPQGGSVPRDQRVTGKLHVAPLADPARRTVELLVTPETLAPWVKAGVTAYMEITRAEVDEELAIPEAAVVQDDLNKVYFRRDPKSPDKVIRVEADLGVSDGKWVVVNSGLAEGDEVVLDGVYELKLTGGGKATGGHFHADGTWHEAHGPEKE